MLILASTSETRKALLAGAGLTFEVRSAGVNERALEAEWAGEDPTDLALRLSAAKAMGVDGEAVIGADQVLALESRRLHKPASRAEARAQLLELRGRSHRLHSGVALARHGRVVWTHVATATLTMRQFDDAELERVLAAEGDRALLSVGGYRLEGPAIRLFEAIEGDYFTILGLPLLPLLAALREHAPETLWGFT